MKISERIRVLSQPTVVRLEQLKAGDNRWIVESFFQTPDIKSHLASFQYLLAQAHGAGVFLIGAYGSGKSHFLAYLANAAAQREKAPAVFPISLLAFRGELSLESIVEQSLPGFAGASDRRVSWGKFLSGHDGGAVLLLDEVSEFLRSKPSRSAFNEDIRFLQFLGEFGQEQRLWVVAALQEQIEQTGAMEHDLYRKIKDRYPHRYLLTPAHVRDLIAHNLLRREEGTGPALDALSRELAPYLGDSTAALLPAVYPLHPATLDILEEVRDRFSQTRGVVDFVLTRLGGDPARKVNPFLDRSWGELLCPDAVFDHFSDLFEIQPDFAPLAQKALPEWRRLLPQLFEKDAQRELAWRALKCLVLAHLSPRRDGLSAETVARWVLPKISALEPEQDQRVVSGILEKLSREGVFVRRRNSHFILDLSDDSAAELERLLVQAKTEWRERGEAPWPLLPEVLEGTEFNPFEFSLHRWQRRRVKWHWHDRDISVLVGGGASTEAPETEPALLVGIPWGPPPEGPGRYKVIPRPLEVSEELFDLAALAQVLQRPLAERVKSRARERLAARRAWVQSAIRACYADAVLTPPQGSPARVPLEARTATFSAWVNTLGEWALRHTFPLFEKFAPSAGPLSREQLREFTAFALSSDLTAADVPDAARIVREGYLVPLGLLARKGVAFTAERRVEQHELVKLILPILDRRPAPSRVYEALSAPLHGLTSDQIHVLLIYLLALGEIDIRKGNASFRDHFETLPLPLSYDEIVHGQALPPAQIHELESVVSAFNLKPPKHWTVLAQRNALERVREESYGVREKLSRFLKNLGDPPHAPDVAHRLNVHLDRWAMLDGPTLTPEGFTRFLAAGPLNPFLAESRELASLPDRYERLVRETQRFRHLLAYPCLKSCEDPAIASRLQTVGDVPSLADPDAAERWLVQAVSVYDLYRTWYRSAHDQFWRGLAAHEVWRYQPPAVFRSRQLGKEESLEEVLKVRSKVVEKKCSGLSDLDFQPVCRCGFDGKSAPILEPLKLFEKAKRELDRSIEKIFAQPAVRERLGSWVEQGWEDPRGVTEFLEGKTPWPNVGNLALFDQHLAGLTLVRTLDAGEWIVSLGRGPWDEVSFFREAARLFERHGQKLFFEFGGKPLSREAALWGVRQCLKYGVPLPADWPAVSGDIDDKALSPSDLSSAALQNLGALGLSENVVARVLGWILNGQAALPEDLPPAGIVRAVLDVVQPPAPVSPEIWARHLRNLYLHARPLETLRPSLFQERLAEWTRLALDPAPPPLGTLLSMEKEAQWVIVDALGAVLADLARDLLTACLAPHWTFHSLRWAEGPAASTTDRFYAELLKGSPHRFEKINPIDRLIHERSLDWEDFEKLARAELDIQGRRLAAKLDPRRPILWTGDHGFRREGARYVHGGSTSAERVVPVFVFIPCRKS